MEREEELMALTDFIRDDLVKLDYVGVPLALL